MQYNTRLFQTFSDNRLIEIVKNAKQFGYDDTTRDAALEVLKARGITEEDLKLTGNFSNYKYDYSRTIYRSYINNSRVAFIAYTALIVYKVLTIFHFIDIDPSGSFSLIVGLTFTILFLVFLTMSFFDHMNFYRSAGKELGLGDQIIFFVVGMPFYVFMYFFYKNQMKEEMRMVE